MLAGASQERASSVLLVLLGALPSLIAMVFVLWGRGQSKGGEVHGMRAGALLQGLGLMNNTLSQVHTHAQEDSELAAAQANNVQQLLRELQGRLESLKQLSSRLGTLPESLQAVLKAQLEDALGSMTATAAARSSAQARADAGQAKPTFDGELSTGAAIRNASFSAQLYNMYDSMLQYQRVLDNASERGQIVGNILWFPQQTLFYAANAASPSVRTLCEVGFGAGHSTLLYLSMNPNLTVYTFDIFELGPFQAAGADFIRRGPHGTRWHAFKGDSALTVPDFAAEHPGLTCDIVHVDGNHARPFPYLDLMNLGLLAHPYTVALIDDANDADTQADMARAVSEGIVFPPECMRAATTTDPRFASAPAWDKEFCFAFYRNATRLANATI